MDMSRNGHNVDLSSIHFFHPSFLNGNGRTYGRRDPLLVRMYSYTMYRVTFVSLQVSSSHFDSRTLFLLQSLLLPPNPVAALRGCFQALDLRYLCLYELDRFDFGLLS